MKKKLLIGILTIALDERLADNYAIYREYETQLDALGAELVVFTPYSIDWNKEQIHGLKLLEGEWQAAVTGMPDVVYNRLYGTHQETVQRLIAVLGPERVYNHNNRLDKLTVYRYLAASDLNQYLPPTAVYSWETLSLWLKQYARVILKPQLGHYGVHIYLIHQTDTDYTIFAETLRNPPLYLYRRTTAQLVD